MKFSFDKSKPVGSRISDVQVKEGEAFVPLDPNKVYGVVTNNYVRGGGDGYKIFSTAAQNAYDFGPNLEQAVADYLGAHNPYKPYTDGRITDLTPAGYTPPPPPAPAAAPTATAPATTAPAAPAPTAQSPAPTATAPAAVEAQGQTTPPAAGPTKYTVVKGDSLWKIAESTYGDGEKWTDISKANTLRNPNIILVGEELELPAK
jgi:5'-nucleotidase